MTGRFFHLCISSCLSFFTKMVLPAVVFVVLALISSVNSKALVTIGTRGSPLALAQVSVPIFDIFCRYIWIRHIYLTVLQAYETKRLLGLHFPELSVDGAVEIKKIMTKGDSILNQALSEIGGKGLFTKELDVALLDNSVNYVFFALIHDSWLNLNVIVTRLIFVFTP